MKYTVVFNYTCGSKWTYGTINVEGKTPEDAIRHLNPSSFDIYKDVYRINLCETRDVKKIIGLEGQDELEIRSIGMYTCHVNSELNLKDINNPDLDHWSFYDKQDKELY